MDGRVKTIVGRLTLIAALTLGACVKKAPAGPPLVEDQQLVQSARDVVALIGAYDCERLPRYLPASAAALFKASFDPALMAEMTDPLERACFVLGVMQQYPRSETMEVRALSQTTTSAKLHLVEPEEQEGVLIDLSEPLPPARLDMVKDAGAWKLDPAWVVVQVQDQKIRQDLLTAWLSPIPPPADSGIVNGVATSTSFPAVIYGAPSGNDTAYCFSALSRSGALFMIRKEMADSSATYASGDIPVECPTEGLDLQW